MKEMNFRTMVARHRNGGASNVAVPGQAWLAAAVLDGFGQG
jgi:hypothetical protein